MRRLQPGHVTSSLATRKAATPFQLSLPAQGLRNSGPARFTHPALSSAQANGRFFVPLAHGSDVSSAEDTPPNGLIEQQRLQKILRDRDLDVKAPTQRVASNVQPLPAAADLDNHSPTADVVRATLAASLVQHRSLDARDALLEIQSDRLGERVWKWLLNADVAEKSRIGWDLHALDILAHLLIAEGQYTVVIQGIESYVRSLALTRDRLTDEQCTGVSWLGRFMGSLMKVHCRRSVEGSADIASRSYLDFCELYRRVPKMRAISRASIDSALCRFAKPGRMPALYPNTSGPLYDEVLERFRIQGSRGTGMVDDLHKATRQSYAQLTLAHPTSPDPGPALDMFRRAEKANPRFLHFGDAAERIWKPKLAGETVKQLRKQKLFAEARFVESLSSRYFSKPVPSRKIMCSSD